MFKCPNDVKEGQEAANSNKGQLSSAYEGCKPFTMPDF